MLIGLLILIWSWRLLKDSVNILLEATPKHIDPDGVIAVLKEHIPEIKDIHDVHIWVITSKMYSMTAHVTIDDLSISESEEILGNIVRLLDEKFDIQHVNIQFETERPMVGVGEP